TGGTALCSSAAASVSLVGGAFQASLGDSCTTIVRANPDLWIDVLIDGASVGRTKLGAVPYAVEADHAVSASSATTATTAATASALAAGPVAGSLMFFNVQGSAIAAPCAINAGSIVDCTCPAGTFVVSGGGDAGQLLGRFMRESRAISNTTWRITCAAGGTD